MFNKRTNKIPILFAIMATITFLVSARDSTSINKEPIASQINQTESSLSKLNFEKKNLVQHQ